MQTSSFTTYSNGLANVLINQVGVSDPIQNPTNINQYNAIWDTGASGTVITNRIVQQLNLLPTGMARVCTANGDCNVNTYVIDLWLPNKICIQRLRVTEGTISSADLLIGMDVMNMGDFSVSNFGGKTIFSFRVPSCATTDYVALGQAQQPKHANKIGMNDPCPCGSGKKYKKCCRP
ncbi:MAG TPA: SEC-C metal-binding domain-containing protein [Clostridia bacterium]|nr:SEC-C metal-binding domain-containing protein [Clostridia bacterium]